MYKLDTVRFNNPLSVRNPHLSERALSFSFQNFLLPIVKKFYNPELVNQLSSDYFESLKSSYFVNDKVADISDFIEILNEYVEMFDTSIGGGIGEKIKLEFNRKFDLDDKYIYFFIRDEIESSKNRYSNRTSTNRRASTNRRSLIENIEINEENTNEIKNLFDQLKHSKNILDESEKLEMLKKIFTDKKNSRLKTVNNKLKSIYNNKERIKKFIKNTYGKQQTYKKNYYEFARKRHPNKNPNKNKYNSKNIFTAFSEPFQELMSS